MTDVPIFSLLGAPVLGELGDASVVERSSDCEVCGMRPPPRFRSVEYVFDYWAGEDLVAFAGHHYAVSDRLRAELERVGVQGVEFRPMAVTESEDFEAPAGGLPSFSYMAIIGHAEGPEIWWESETCAACGVTTWRPTDEGVRAQAAGLTGQSGIPRQVYRSTWDGVDVFAFEDPGPPVITERVTDVFTRLDVSGVMLEPAEWVGTS